jgi:uncharacterized membrane protein
MVMMIMMMMTMIMLMLLLLLLLLMLMMRTLLRQGRRLERAGAAGADDGAEPRGARATPQQRPGRLG